MKYFSKNKKSRKTKKNRKLRNKSRKNLKIRKGGFISLNPNNNKYIKKAYEINPNLETSVNAHKQDLQNMYKTSSQAMGRLGKASASLGNAVQAYSTGKPLTATGYAASSLGHGALAAYNVGKIATYNAPKVAKSGIGLASQVANTGNNFANTYSSQYSQQ